MRSIIRSIIQSDIKKKKKKESYAMGNSYPILIRMFLNQAATLFY
jgi:hypothetical protein